MTPEGKSVLVLRKFGVAFGDQVVLASVDLSVPPRGLVCLVGPAGAGKSTLLRTIAGLNDAQPALRTWGTATYLAAPLGERRPALVHQNARLLTSTVRENLVSALPDRASTTKPQQTKQILTRLRELDVAEGFAQKLRRSVMELTMAEQRILSVARAAMTGAPLVLMDEPTANLADDDADVILALVAKIARERAVVLVTHNQKRAKSVGGRIALIAGGRVVESRRTESFFDTPASEPGKKFVSTGRCSVPGPMARKEDLSPSSPPPPPLPPEARIAASKNVGPRGFHWLRAGVLGGLPRPGIVESVSRDLEGLRRLGVTHLFTLEEERTVPSAVLRKHGLEGRHFPIVDMRAPELVAAQLYCADVEALVDSGAVVAVHCRAGLGRTGTMLTSQLIWEGMSALEALALARDINPRWVQSDAQVKFLTSFDRLINGDSDTAHETKSLEV